MAGFDVALVAPDEFPLNRDVFVCQLSHHDRAVEQRPVHSECHGICVQGFCGVQYVVAHEHGVAVAQIFKEQRVHGGQVFLEIGRMQAFPDGCARLAQIIERPVQADPVDGVVQRGLAGVPEEIVEGEAEIGVALRDDVLGPRLPLELRGKARGIEEALGGIPFEVHDLRVQVFAVVEQVVGGDVRHHVGQRRDGEIDVALIRIDADAVLREVKHHGLRRPLVLYGRDADEGHAGVLPSPAPVLQWEGQVAEAVPVPRHDHAQIGVAKQLHPGLVGQRAHAVPARPQGQRLIEYVLRILYHPKVGDVGRRSVEAQGQFPGLLSVGEHLHRLFFKRRRLRGGRVRRVLRRRVAPRRAPVVFYRLFLILLNAVALGVQLAEAIEALRDVPIRRLLEVFQRLGVILLDAVALRVQRAERRERVVAAQVGGLPVVFHGRTVVLRLPGVLPGLPERLRGRPGLAQGRAPAHGDAQADDQSKQNGSLHGCSPPFFIDVDGLLL